MVIVLALLSLSFLWCNPLPASPGVTTEQPPANPYRRIYVPADRVDLWPRDGEKYIPVESKDFEAWTQVANDAASLTPPPANIDLAEYTASLDDNGLVRGTAKWTITLRGKNPALLPLSKVSQNLSDARWQDGSLGAVRIGLWGSADGDTPSAALEVPSSGILEFNWSARSTTLGNKILIPWRFPLSTSSRLAIEIPDGLIPAIEGAVVLDSSALTPQDAATKKPRRRWSLAFAPTADASLQFSRTKGDAVAQPSGLLLTDDTKFEIRQSGLTVASTWQLKGQFNERRELTIPLPRAAQVTSVSANGRELNWHIERANDIAADQAIVELPDVAKRDIVELKITSWFPLLIDKTWKLPLLRPDDVSWSRGKYHLSIAAPLELQSLNPIDCLQVGANHVGEAGADVEVYEFTSYSPAGVPQVTISRRQPELFVRVGSLFVLSDPDVTGRLATEFSVARGSLHHLTGDIAPGWNVETVETIPSDAMADWFIDRRGNRRQLEIQLTKAVSANQKVSVIAMGRLQKFGLATPIAADTLRAIDWSGARVVRHLLSFQTTNPFSIQPVGDLPFIDRESLTDEDIRLFDDANSVGRVVDLSDADSSSGLQLSFKRPTFSAEIDSRFEVTGTGLRQLHEIVVEPNENSIDRLLVYASAPLGDGVNWLDKSTNYPIQAERLPASDPQMKSLPADGELWSLRLSRPASGSVPIAASVTSKTFKRGNLPLLSLPEAVQQHARVVLHSNPEVSTFAKPSGLAAIPIPADPSSDRGENLPSARAAFRYNPADCLTDAKTPSLSLTTNGPNHSPSLICRDAHLESFYWPDGRATHVCEFKLENLGTGEFNPPLPASARLKSAIVNGQSVGLATSETTRSLPTIHLPAQSRFTTVVLYFETREAELATGSLISQPLSADGNPILSGKWTVWLPNDFQVASESELASGGFDWRRRLFGPLARNASASPFNPLRAGDWARAVNRFAVWQTSAINPPLMNSAAPATVENPNGREQPLTQVSGPNIVAAELPGWHVHRENFVADVTPTSIIIENRPATTAWSVVTLIGAFLGGTWLCKRSWRAFITLAAATASLALALPFTIAPLATGALWGLLLSSLAEWPRRLLAGNSNGQTIRRRAIATPLAVALTAALISSAAFANPGDTPTDSAAAKPHVERVLIPVDQNQKPSGTKYFLSERFLRSLLPKTAAAGSDSNRWLLREASYSASLVQNRAQSDMSPGTWSLTFDVESFSQDTTVNLNLVRDEAAWQSSAMLDGVPTPLQWHNDGRSCSVHIDQPARYALTIFCTPKIVVDSDRALISLTIPPSLSAVFRFRQPAALSGLRINGIPTATPASDSQITFPLGATDRLALEWPRTETKSESIQTAAITSLSWLHLDASSTRLDTKYIIEGDSHRLEPLTIAYDEQWTPDSAPGLSIESGEVDKATGKRAMKVAVPAASAGRHEIELRWRFAGSPSIGNFRVPTVELTSAPTAQRWFAFSSDAAFECTMSESVAAATTPKEFITKWGLSSDAAGPQQVVDDTSPNPVRTISIRPRLSEPVVDSDLHVAVGERELRVALQAAVTPGKPSDSQCKLIVPANMKIDEVRLTEGDRQIPTRQVRSADNQLQIFFGQPVDADYRLTVAGRLPLNGVGPFAVPQLTFFGSSAGAQQFHLYRDDDIQVDLQHFPPADDSSTEPTDLPPIEWLVRPLGVYRLGQAAAVAPTFTVNKSGPMLAGDSLTTLTRDANSWSASYHAQFVVQSGALDVLRLRAPTLWTEPFQIESNVPAIVDTTLHDEKFRSIIVRFANTVAKGGRVAVKIRAALPSPPNGEVELPEIAPETHVDGHRYAIVPASVDSQPIAWSEAGVRAAAVPPLLASPSIDLTNQRQLEIVGQPFRVVQQSKPATQLAPRIRVADTFVSADTHGARLVVVRFVLASGGPTNCTLALPPGQELRVITLDGRPALTAAIDATHWQVALGSADLPQIIQVVSQSVDDLPDPSSELRRPVLLSNGKVIPVDVSLWTISLRNEATQSTALLPTVSAVDQAALRLDRLVSIAESTTSSSRELPETDIANWFSTWSPILKNMRDRARNIGAVSGATPQVSRSSQELISRSSDRLDAWLKQQTRRLGAALPVADAAAQAADPVPSVNLTDAIDRPETLRFVSEGGTDRLAIELQSPVSRGKTQGLGILIVAAFASAAIWLARSPLSQDFICRWPHIVGILFGLAWWAWLAPSWLGLVIIAGTLWHSLRFDWPGRSIRAEASTVLRSTRSH